MVKTKNTEKKLDILDGRIIPSFLRFMIPILLTNLLQQLYSTADTMIVGNMGGTDALAAVGATGSIINLLTTIFISVFTGTSILVSRAKGAGDEEGLKRTVTTTAIMSVSFGIILMVLGDLLAYPLLHATKCPESIIDSAARYISIYFIGIPASLFFNFAAAAIRSLGDSRSPLIYLTISGLFNVILSIILVFAIGNPVESVATATAVSMYLCAFLFFIHLTRLKGGARLTFKRFKFDLSVFIKTLRFGIPAVITGAAYAITNILIQPHINYYGDMGISACTAASAIEGYLSSITGAVALTMITFLSQNIAAGKRERVRRLLSRGYLIAILLTLLYSLVVILFDEQLLSLFIPGENDAIRFASVRFIYVLGIGGVINGIMSINVAALQSYGYTTIHTVSNFFAICVFRIFWTKVLYPLNHKPEMLWACYPASWIITAAALFTITVMLTKKLTQGKEFKL